MVEKPGGSELKKTTERETDHEGREEEEKDGVSVRDGLEEVLVSDTETEADAEEADGESDGRESEDPPRTSAGPHDTTIPVINVQPGEPATFTCALLDQAFTSQTVQWFKQSVGDTMKFIVLVEKNIEPQYSPDFPESRIAVHIDEKFCKLTILRTNPEDEGMYHCGINSFIMNTWSGTYLLLKGKTASDYTVVQQPTVSDPLRPGDSMSLQCSLLSNSDNKTCPGDHSVYWVRVGSHESDPGVIYTEGNRQDGCNNDTQSSPKSCLHHFSKTIHSSDAGTSYYYCAVATCGRILFGNGTRIQVEERITSRLIIMVISIILAISLIGNMVFICYIRALRTKCKGFMNASLQERHVNASEPEHVIVS
ncbi:uncharacterized protein LOC115426804 [Sphaeramia orbicularis]|uniref:uncharacterized protein LOC115426804 n=1 Tax=Sphaeramia orbicularis TaxID=375764 RepID=UPI00117D7D27|nr:uncharacterized protein LOC115426804 [Sphaeramia orbicularis]